jgi:hypothetical protein
MRNPFFLLAVVLAGAAMMFGLAGCEAITNGNVPGTDVLTINNLPGGSSWVVTALNYQDAIDSQAGLAAPDHQDAGTFQGRATVL